MDALALARVQFAANITFHILFPTIVRHRDGCDRYVAFGFLDPGIELVDADASRIRNT